jgi:hypothetical protein
MAYLDRTQIQLKFCTCSANEQVRLIQAGYIGGTPENPKSVITIRLLRFFHTLWKYCSVRFEPFAQALDEFLDDGNPLFLNKEGDKVSFHAGYFDFSLTYPTLDT